MSRLNRRTVLTAGLALSALAATGLAPLMAEGLKSSPPPEGAELRIVSPQDGDTVPQEFTVVFGLTGMGIAPAGVEREGTGHHHLLVDASELPPQDLPMGSPPIHFGGGQTETVLTLEPGEHTLQLIMGDYLHIPHSPPITSEMITITVE